MSSAGPILKDPGIQVKRIFSGLRYPTSMAFLGPDDILVLEKDEGTVQRIVNGNILGEPLLQVKVDRTDERGMLALQYQEMKLGILHTFSCIIQNSNLFTTVKESLWVIAYTGMNWWETS